MSKPTDSTERETVDQATREMERDIEAGRREGTEPIKVPNPEPPGKEE